MKKFRLLLSSLLATSIINCGGGGIADIDSAPSDGIDGSGNYDHRSSGTITGFGSVIVNGVRYDTNNAIVTVNGDPVTTEQLNIGDFVTVLGSLENGSTNGVANQVIYYRSVAGVIHAIDLDAKSFQVLGQTITVDDTTVFAEDILPRSINGLEVGQFVQVSGAPSSGNNLLATRVDVTDSSASQLSGNVTNISLENGELRINGQLIEFDPDTLSDEELEQLALGGQFFVTLLEAGEGNPLLESLIFLDDLFELSPGASTALGGIITEVADDGLSFTLFDETIVVTDETELTDGTLEDIQVNASVTVTGVYTEDETVEAETIEFGVSNQTELNTAVGPVTAKVNNEDELNGGQLTVNGTVFLTNADTRFINLIDSEAQEFGLADIAIDDIVTITALETDAGPLALLIRREDPAGPIPLEFAGPIDAIDETGMTLLEYDLLFDEDTVFIVEQVEVSVAAFVEAAPVGSIVEFTAMDTQGTIVATRVELIFDSIDLGLPASI